jgi:hypothetical protein
LRHGTRLVRRHGQHRLRLAGLRANAHAHIVAIAASGRQ